MASLKLNQVNELLEKNKRLIVLLFFVLFFAVGIDIYKDYGMSWDEYAQWHDNGYANFNFIVHNDKATLLNGIDKYHGPAFELLLIGIEKAFRLTDSREIFFMRHLVIFITFFISSVFFFLTAKKIFKNWKIALIGFLFFVLSPHIFANSFNNSKDAVFLAFFTISIYTLICFHEKPTYLRAIIYAIVTAFTIDIRIIGIIIPAISLLILLTDLIVSIKNKTKSGSKILVGLFYFIPLIPLIILFWPVLWIDPIYHFIQALKENSVYPWNGAVLYFGKTYIASELPWHYIPFWIFISKPVFYSVLFFAGVVTLLGSFVKQRIEFITKKRSEAIALIWFFLPLIAMLILKSTTFDTGRHLYFMNGGFVLISLFGLQAVMKAIEKTTILAYSVYLILFLSLSSVIYKMIKIHPYQNLYFNSFAGGDMNKIKNNFEFDYWGVASREVLENVLAMDTSRNIKIFAENFPEKVNARILKPEQRERLTYTDTPEEANYFIVDYRWHREEEYVYRNEAYSAVIGNTKIITAFRVRKPEELYNQVKGKILKRFSTDFEHIQPFWANNNIVQPYCGAHSGLFSAKVDSVVEYSSGLTITDLNYIYNKKRIVLKTSFWQYNDQGQTEAKFVITIAKPDGTTYFWTAINETKSADKDTVKEWKEVIGAVDLPVIKSERDIIYVYLWNTGKKRIFIDDIKIDLIEEK